MSISLSGVARVKAAGVRFTVRFKIRNGRRLKLCLLSRKSDWTEQYLSPESKVFVGLRIANFAVCNFYNV